jgi:hypothetical protein
VHPIEIVGNFDLPIHEADAADLLRHWRVERHNLDHRLAGLFDE